MWYPSIDAFGTCFPVLDHSDKCFARKHSLLKHRKRQHGSDGNLSDASPFMAWHNSPVLASHEPTPALHEQAPGLNGTAPGCNEFTMHNGVANFIPEPSADSLTQDGLGQQGIAMELEAHDFAENVDPHTIGTEARADSPLMYEQAPASNVVSLAAITPAPPTTGAYTLSDAVQEEFANIGEVSEQASPLSPLPSSPLSSPIVQPAPPPAPTSRPRKRAAPKSKKARSRPSLSKENLTQQPIANGNPHHQHHRKYGTAEPLTFHQAVTEHSGPQDISASDDRLDGDLDASAETAPEEPKNFSEEEESPSNPPPSSVCVPSVAAVAGRDPTSPQPDSSSASQVDVPATVSAPDLVQQVLGETVDSGVCTKQTSDGDSAEATQPVAEAEVNAGVRALAKEEEEEKHEGDAGADADDEHLEDYEEPDDPKDDDWTPPSATPTSRASRRGKGSKPVSKKQSATPARKNPPTPQRNRTSPPKYGLGISFPPTASLQPGRPARTPSLSVTSNPMVSHLSAPPYRPLNLAVNSSMPLRATSHQGLPSTYMNTLAYPSSNAYGWLAPVAVGQNASEGQNASTNGTTVHTQSQMRPMHPNPYAQAAVQYPQQYAYIPNAVQPSSAYYPQYQYASVQQNPGGLVYRQALPVLGYPASSAISCTASMTANTGAGQTESTVPPAGLSCRELGDIPSRRSVSSASASASASASGCSPESISPIMPPTPQSAFAPNGLSEAQATMIASNNHGLPQKQVPGQGQSQGNGHRVQASGLVLPADAYIANGAGSSPASNGFTLPMPTLAKQGQLSQAQLAGQLGGQILAYPDIERRAPANAAAMQMAFKQHEQESPYYRHISRMMVGNALHQPSATTHHQSVEARQNNGRTSLTGQALVQGVQYAPSARMAFDANGSLQQSTPQ